MQASVKVMRSYDYCHFEVCLSLDKEMTLGEINNMRKDAARLADEAVRQYIVAKDLASKKLKLEDEKNELIKEIERIKSRCTYEWCAQDKAKLKALEDKEYFDRYNYNYEDDQERPF
jgi:hypothetical protein